MTKKLITLTPTGRFYFGGDATFETGKGNPNHEFASYIVKSNMFPQQTTLLGMLRYLILSKSDAFDNITKKIRNPVDAEKLIGKESFCVGKENSFGRIKKLYPCFLQMKRKEGCWEDLFLAPKDYKYDLSFNNTTEAYFNGEKLSVPTITNYNAKDYVELKYLTSKEEEIPTSSIFCEDSRIGINKDYKGRTQTSAFFKQISYRLGKKKESAEYRFAFYAEIEGELPQKEMVSIGGDNSQFILEVSDISDIEYPKCYQKMEIDGLYGKIILTSDTYLQKEDLSNVLFSINDTTPFRFLKSTIATRDYHILTDDVKRSERFDLYKNASVFYFNDQESLEDFVKILESYKEFCMIGYNTYKVVLNQKNK